MRVTVFRRPGAAIFLSVALTFVVVMMGTTLPTPLYPIYQQRLGFSEVMITVIFAAYAVGVIGALIVTGRWSDQIGRRPMLGLGLVCSGLSACCFLWGQALAPLLAGRVLSGISAGIFTGTATVAVVELAPEAWSGAATLVATAANMLGLGLGPLFAGILAQYVPWPVRLCFALDLVLVVVMSLAIWRAPETAQRPDKPQLRLQVPGVPPEARAVFVPAAIAGFAGFAVLGLFTAVAPAFLGQVLHLSNHALTGLVVFIVFVGSTAGQLGQGWLPERQRLPLGCAVLVVGMVCVGAALALSWLALLIAGAVVAGLGHGISFRAGMGQVTAASPADRRGEVASSFFVVVYIAISIPVVGLGLVSERIGLTYGGVLFTAVVAVLALIAIVLLIARRARTEGSERA